MIWSCTLPMEPQGKARPRCRCRGRRAMAYMPAAYRAWLQAAAMHYRASWTGEPIARPVALDVALIHRRPQRRPQVVPPGDIWRSGVRVRAPRVPDADNGAGSVMDAMTDAGILDDDRWIVRLTVASWWSAEGEDAHVEAVLREESWTDR